MLDINFIRQNKELCKKSSESKKISCDLDKLLEIDDKKRELQRIVESLRAKRKTISAQIQNAPAQEKEKLKD